MYFFREMAEGRRSLDPVTEESERIEKLRELNMGLEVENVSLKEELVIVKKKEEELRKRCVKFEESDIGKKCMELQVKLDEQIKEGKKMSEIILSQGWDLETREI